MIDQSLFLTIEVFAYAYNLIYWGAEPVFRFLNGIF
jgi:hypothetical protein